MSVVNFSAITLEAAKPINTLQLVVVNPYTDKSAITLEAAKPINTT